MWPKKLSEHLSSYEFIATQHREFLDQQDNPPLQVIKTALWYARTIFEPARNLVGPLYVSSGYRCPDLNAAIGGSKTSMHTKGAAADVYPAFMGLKDAMINIIESEIPFDQIIFEYGRWIHLGGTYEGATPRRQALMIFERGHYEFFNKDDGRIK